MESFGRKLTLIVHLCLVSCGAVIAGSSVDMDSSTNSPAEHRPTPVELDDTMPSIGYWIFVALLILLLTLLMILAVILVRIGAMNAERTKSAATIEQPIDLLTAYHQIQREDDSIHSIIDERYESSGYATVYSGITDCNSLGPQLPPTYNATPAHPTSNSACNDLQRGGTNPFGFLHYTNVCGTVSKTHHPEYDVAGSAHKHSSLGVLPGKQQDASNFRQEDPYTQTTCVGNDKMTVGADGTEYLQMNAVKYLVQTPTSSSSREPPTQSAFATSTYAHIDHSLKVLSK